MGKVDLLQQLNPVIAPSRVSQSTTSSFLDARSHLLCPSASALALVSSREHVNVSSRGRCGLKHGFPISKSVFVLGVVVTLELFREPLNAGFGDECDDAAPPTGACQSRSKRTGTHGAINERIQLGTAALVQLLAAPMTL